MTENVTENPTPNQTVRRLAGMNLRKEVRSIALFTGGAFFTVLLALAVGSSEPLDRLSGTGLLARLWAASVGLLPGLVFCAGIAGLGAWEFLSGERQDLRRHARGLAVTALGLAVLLGAYSDLAGGFLGHHTSGAVARFVHILPAALIGFAAFLLPIWIVWLKPVILEGGIPENRTSSGEDEATAHEDLDSDEDAPVVLTPVARPRGGVDLGVSPAEAAALIPEDLPSWRTQPRRFGSTETPLVPTSPYPEDVRLRGEIPEGAKAIQVPHAEPKTRPQDRHEPAVPSVHERAPDREWKRPAVPPGEDLAFAADQAELADPVLEMPATIGRRRREEDLEELRLAIEELTLEPEPQDPLVEVASVAPVPVRAQPKEDLEGDLEVEEDDVDAPPRPSWEQSDLFGKGEEPVDAYGTPISVVQTLRADVSTEEDADESTEEDGSIEEDSVEDDEVVEDGEDEDLDEDEEESIDADDLVEDEVFAEAETDSGPESEADLETEAEVDDEPEVTLKPVAAARGRKKSSPKPRSTSPAPEAEGDRAQLLTDIGCHLLERGRVAVSMLQKQYGMDFEEATTVLDELQRLGLIGPYLGGQRRDILLTREEWLEKVSSL
jgi:hypothetical protein